MSSFIFSNPYYLISASSWPYILIAIIFTLIIFFIFALFCFICTDFWVFIVFNILFIFYGNVLILTLSLFISLMYIYDYLELQFSMISALNNKEYWYYKYLLIDGSCPINHIFYNLIAPKWYDLIDPSLHVYLAINNSNRFLYDKEIFDLKSYSTSSSNGCGLGTNLELNNISNNERLDPYWFTGLIDAEGCFNVTVSKRLESIWGWRIVPQFSLSMNKREINTMTLIRNYLGVGKIYFESNRIIYRVSSFKDLITIIIPHFEKYPLLTNKYADFVLFKSIVIMLDEKKHRTLKGFMTILGLRYNLNNGISKRLLSAFPNIVPVPRPVIPKGNINIPWLIGFIEGEGCFYLGIIEFKSSYSVRLTFKVTQHIKDKELLHRITKFLGFGNVEHERADVLCIRVGKFSTIFNNLIPLLKANALHTHKQHDFDLFCKAATIINNKGRYWTQNEINDLRDLKKTMNKYESE